MYMCMEYSLHLSKDHKNKIFFDKLVHVFLIKFTLIHNYSVKVIKTHNFHRKKRLSVFDAGVYLPYLTRLDIRTLF